MEKNNPTGNVFYSQIFLCICHVCKQPKYRVETTTENYIKCDCSQFNLGMAIENLDDMLEIGKQLFSGSRPLTQKEAEDLDELSIQESMEDNNEYKGPRK